MGGVSSRTLTSGQYVDASLYIPQSWTGMLVSEEFESQTIYELYAKQVTQSGIEGEDAEISSNEERIAVLAFPSANWTNFMGNLEDLRKAASGQLSQPPEDSDYFVSYQLDFDKSAEIDYTIFKTNTGKELRIDLSKSGWSGSSEGLTGSKTITGTDANQMLIKNFIQRYGPKIKPGDRSKIFGFSH